MDSVERVPLRAKHAPFTGEDVEVRFERSPRVGHLVGKFYIDESLIRQVGARAVGAAVDEMGRRAVYEHQHEVERAVASLILDSAWAKPIIENEMRKAVRAMVHSLWSTEEKQAMRDWFDVFTGHLMGTPPETKD